MFLYTKVAVLIDRSEIRDAFDIEFLMKRHSYTK